MTKRTVVVESPLRGDVARNVRYAEACMLDSLRRGEAPMLGHLLYPRVLDDADEEQRRMGTEAHCAWIGKADALVVYLDLGLTGGMADAMTVAALAFIRIEERRLGDGWETASTQPSATADFR